jgi:hypothetical protein
MSEQLYATLKELHTKRKREALQEGTGEIREFIFHNGDGNPRGQNSVRYVLKRVLERPN